MLFRSTLKDFSLLVNKFSEVLTEEKMTKKVFDKDEISKSIKENFSFCWYQFYKFLFTFTNRWRTQVKDLETFCVGILVMLNASHNKSFRVKDLNIKKYQKSIMSADDIGLNAMSISEITKIPRPTVVRKVRYLIDNDYLSINEKKLITVNIRGKAFKISTDLQNKNMISLSNFIFRLFNQIKVINSN